MNINTIRFGLVLAALISESFSDRPLLHHPVRYSQSKSSLDKSIYYTLSEINCDKSRNETAILNTLDNRGVWLLFALARDVLE